MADHYRARTNRDWRPQQFDLQGLHRNSEMPDPMGKDFDYTKALKSLELDAEIQDLHALMVDPRQW